MARYFRSPRTLGSPQLKLERRWVGAQCALANVDLVCGMVRLLEPIRKDDSGYHGCPSTGTRRVTMLPLMSGHCTTRGE